MVFQSKRKQELQAALEKLEAAENRVSELEADWQAIQRSVAVAVMSGDGLFESVSDVFLELLGYQEQQLIGKHHRVLCKPEDARGDEAFGLFLFGFLPVGHSAGGASAKNAP